MHYILIITLVLIVLFLRSSRVGQDVTSWIMLVFQLVHRWFMVMTQMMVPTLSFQVLCTNEAGQTYISGVRWAQLVARYGMQPGERCTFFLDHGLDALARCSLSMWALSNHIPTITAVNKNSNVVSASVTVNTHSSILHINTNIVPHFIQI